MFGPIDKGAGIEMPEAVVDHGDGRDRWGRRELVGAALADSSEDRPAVVRPDAAPAPDLRSLRQRVGRWLVGRPRPSGT